MSAVSRPALRPFLPADTQIVAAIIVASIDELAADDYGDAQREAWASFADDEDALTQRLASQLTLLATLDGAPVGIASLKGGDTIDLLYVHPGAAGQGVGTLLLDALEKLAGARGAAKLTADASDNAQPFFAKRGYAATQRNSITIAGEWLANTTMTKTLEKPKAQDG